VLLRIAGKQLAATDKFASVWAWEQAARLVEHAAASPDTNPHLPNRPGAWNEALMELGATVCALPTPRCESCPVRKHCRAFAMGTTATIPLPSRKPPRAAITHACLLIRDRRGRVLVEQRPTTSAGAGLWAGLWQLPTLDRRERDDTPPALIARELRLTLPKRPKWLARDPFVFKTTHRDVRFVVFELLVPAAATAATPPRRWCDREGFEQLGWSSPMKRLVSAALTSRGDRPAKAGAPAPRARRATRS
jgi:A/G-specific adenine glycosylase